jgi:NADPH:quinone reductase-like Zn-dependent oxidoreductase
MSTALPDAFPAFLATKADGPDGKPVVTRAVGELRAADLPAGEVTIRVRWSGVNYKDGLATIANGGVARISPIVPGIDIAGVVVEVDGGASVEVGDEVIAHGYDIGVARHGGYAQFARVPAGQVFKRPAELSMRQAMVK